MSPPFLRHSDSDPLSDIPRDRLPVQENMFRFFPLFLFPPPGKMLAKSFEISFASPLFFDWLLYNPMEKGPQFAPPFRVSFLLVFPIKSITTIYVPWILLFFLAFCAFM